MEENEVNISATELKAKCLKRLEEWKKDPQQMLTELKAADEILDNLILEFIENLRKLFVTKAVELTVLGRAVVLFAADDANHVPVHKQEITVGSRFGQLDDSCAKKIIEYLTNDDKEDDEWRLLL